MHFQYLLLARFIVINSFFGALVLAAFGQGWLDKMVSARLAELTLQRHSNNFVFPDPTGPPTPTRRGPFVIGCSIMI